MATTQGIRAGRAFVELFADNRKLVRGLRLAQRKLRAFGGAVRQYGAKVTLISASLATPFISGAKVYADFQQQMANVSTMLDQPEKHLGRFSSAITDMSIEFGESTATLAGGLYDILSASVPPAQALDVLGASAKAAKAGLTETQTAADAITTILNSYGLSAEKAGDVSDWLFSVVKRGKTTFGQLAPAVGKVSTIAATAGVSLEELGASVALLTRNGIGTDEALTAVQAIISSFLKPAAEAADLAKQLGFEMNATTLASEGLAGVLERIEQLPPDAIATLFPNVRALKGVLPALKNLSGFNDDIEAMRNRAGATGDAYKKMTNTVAHGFAQVKQASLAVLASIGEAIAEPLSRAATTVKKYASLLRTLIEQNRQVVLTVAKIILGVALFGSALVAAGITIQVIGSALGGLATGLALIGKVFSVTATVGVAVFKGAIIAVGTVLTALTSPIGLVIAAVAALAAYLIYASGIGGKAIDWLAGKFGSLKDDLGKAFAGIADAIKAGDISLAVKVLWLTVQMEFARGVHALEKLWLSFRNFFLKVGADAWYGLLSVAESVWHGLEVGWIETVAFFSRFWSKFCSFFAATWENVKAAAKRTWNWIKSLFDESFDLQAANTVVEIERRKAIGSISDTQKREAAEIEAQRQSKRDQASRLHEATLAEFGRADLEKHTALDADYEQTLADNAEKLAAAKSAWQEAIEAARAKRQVKKEEDGPEPLEGPGDLESQLAKAMGQVRSQLSSQAEKITARGLFNASAVLSLQSESPYEKRMAEGIEKVEKNTRTLREKQTVVFT